MARKPTRFRLLLLGAAVCLAASCAVGGQGTAAELWTDRPEFAFYAELFNAAQDLYKVEARYMESPAERLATATVYPDLVAASWLKSSSTLTLFQPLDDLFKADSQGGGGAPLVQSAFYPRLLALGSIEDRQYLLPVAFNLPALVFAQDYSQPLSSPFTIELEEIKELGKAYNAETNGVYTRMGFSPTWSDEFLYICAALLGARFEESAPITWNPQALEEAVTWIQRWTPEANTSAQAENDFAFKYLYDPPAKLAGAGRILFAYMDSAELFTLAEERQSGLDFRWIAQGNRILIDEGNIYLGVTKKAKAREAALAFTRWFFQAETQRQILAAAKTSRLMETSFGIAGGFSGIRTVTEQIFPSFYPALLGHMPPESFLTPPAILPRTWRTIKERVILPYLHDRINQTSGEEVRSLERRLADWTRLN